MDALTELLDTAKRAVRRAQEAGDLKPIPWSSIECAYVPLTLRLEECLSTLRKDDPDRTLVCGIGGAPGTGKTTLAKYLEVLFDALYDRRVARFSLDDLYLSRAKRQELAERVHPLFAVRGVAGTHDVELGLDTMAHLKHAASDTVTILPRFEKGRDEPAPRESWPRFSGRPDIVLFDAWFWGAEPVALEELETPINERERQEDPDGHWRKAVNEFLGEGYAELFRSADVWVKLEVPSWDTAVRFRIQQERDLAALPAEERPKLHTEGELRWFLQLLERLARRGERRSPDFVIDIDESHQAKLR